MTIRHQCFELSSLINDLVTKLWETGPVEAKVIAARAQVWLVLALTAPGSLLACDKFSSADTDGSASANASASTPKPKPQLPAPFADLKLGRSLEELKAAYPPLESIDQCAPMLVGGETRMPPLVPGAEKKPRSHCPRSTDVAGMTAGETQRLSAKTGSYKYPLQGSQALTLATAQVRGSLRSGALKNADVLKASGGSKTAFTAVSEVASSLYDGSSNFSGRGATPMTICATVSEDCTSFKAQQVRDYIYGKFSYRELYEGSLKRCVTSKCRAPYMREKKGSIARRFVGRTGGLAGIGLARAIQDDRKLDPSDLSTYAVYLKQSQLDTKTARLGVEIANGLAETEEFWKGSVVLAPGGEPKSPWGVAIIWLTAGKVSRIMLNIADEDKLGELPDELRKLYGKPHSKEAATTRWRIPGGAEALLDIGGNVALIVQAAPPPP